MTGLLGGDDLVARLTRWVSDARTDEAAAARARERWLVQAAEESATFSGVLLDLAERAAPVVVIGHGDRRHRGVIAAVGADFCVLRTPAGRDVLVAFRGISSARLDAGAGAPSGDRAVHVDVALAKRSPPSPVIGRACSSSPRAAPTALPASCVPWDGTSRPSASTATPQPPPTSPSPPSSRSPCPSRAFWRHPVRHGALVDARTKVQVP